MPKIQWVDVPPQLRQHLFDRAKERSITMEDLVALEEWRGHAPLVPEGPWYTLDRSRFAEKVSTRRLSFSKANRRTEKRSNQRLHQLVSAPPGSGTVRRLQRRVVRTAGNELSG